MGVLALMGVLAAILAAVAMGPASSPSWSLCDQHGRCTQPQRVFRVECGGEMWLSPRPVRIPPQRRRHSSGGWCAAHVPPFPD